MLALGRGGVQVIGQARWTGLGRRWVAKYYLTPLRHDELVGHDDHEIHDRHENDEVDDRGDKRSEVQICGIATAVDQLSAQARPLNAALGRRDERIDDVVSECFDEIAERQSHDQSNGDNDNIAAHQEVFEAREHGNSSS